MIAYIIDNEWLYLDIQSPDVESALIQFFSVKHPKAQYANNTEYWDGWYRKFDQRNQRLALPYLTELKRFCEIKDVPLTIEDKRELPYYKPKLDLIKPDMLNGITLMDYQLDAIKAACANNIGIIKAPTGSGKTEIAAGIAKVYGCPTLIVADQRIVIEQLQERLELRSFTNEKVGLFYGGATPNGQRIVVGSIQSINTPPMSLKRLKPEQYAIRLKRARLFQAIASKCHLLIVDEADRAASSNYKNLFKHYYSGRYKYGMSATPFDKDKPIENLLLKENLGSIVYDIPRSVVQSLGRIVPIKFYMIAFGEDGDKADATAFDIAEREIMVENPIFHATVAKVVANYKDDRTLILVDTTNVEELGHALEAIVPNSKFIFGKSSKRERDKCIEAFENGELKCLIGGKILKRGLDLQGGVDNLILCGGGKLWSNFDQSIGRAVRKNTKGWARVFSFFFLNNKYLYSHSRSQLKALVNMEYDSKVIFKNGIIDGTEFVKSKFRRKKHDKSSKTKTKA